MSNFGIKIRQLKMTVPQPLGGNAQVGANQGPGGGGGGCK